MTSKMIYTALVSLTTLLMTTSCIEDRSDYTYEMETNDNTYDPVYVKAALDEQEKSMINFFIEGADKTTGMARNSDTDYMLTTGASGFGMMNIICGVERGWIDRATAVQHILKEARFLDTKARRFEGAWAHWYSRNGNTIAFGNQTAAGEAVETAFLLSGMLAAKEYFSGSDADETEIRTLAEKFYNSVNWRRFIKDEKFYWIWHSDKQGTAEEYELPIVGWNEALIVYILGLAAPDGQNIPQSVYTNTWKGYHYSNPSQITYGYKLPLGSWSGGPLFLSQYSFLSLDPRQMEDVDCNYWKQNVAHTMVNRHYCIYKAPVQNAYSSFDWGLTACSGAGSTPNYTSRSPEYDDGVIAPTAAISAMPYTPFYSIQTLMSIRKNYSKLNGKFGIASSYKPSEKKVNTRYLAVEHAPQAVMIENYRSGLMWKLLMKNDHIQEGLKKAGIFHPNYQAGFYLAISESTTNTYDMIRHPDTGKYQIDFYSESGGAADIKISHLSGDSVYTTTANLIKGANVIEFFSPDIIRSKIYNLTIENGGQSFTIKVNLH
jgi:hypothetical protein